MRTTRLRAWTLPFFFLQSWLGDVSFSTTVQLLLVLQNLVHHLDATVELVILVVLGAFCSIQQHDWLEEPRISTHSTLHVTFHISLYPYQPHLYHGTVPRLFCEIQHMRHRLSAPIPQALATTIYCSRCASRYAYPLADCSSLPKHKHQTIDHPST